MKSVLTALTLALLTTAVHAATPDDAGLKLANENACMTCHAVDHKIIGPSFQAIAARFRNNPQAPAYLLDRLEHGSRGDWGRTFMPPFPQASRQALQQLVQWVLSQQGSNSGR